MQHQPVTTWPALMVALIAGLALSTCSSGGGTSVRCTRDDDCPTGQQCVGGNCQLPADQGPQVCTSTLQCPIGQECRDGLCVPYAAEPDGGPSGDGDAGPGDQPAGDGDQPADPGADEDQRDFSAYHFTLVVAPSGRGGTPAHQCLGPLTPEPNTGPRLPEASAAAGVRLGGLIRDGGALANAGIEVSATEVADPACLPPATSSDAQGAFEFMLPAGSYVLTVTAPDGRVTHDSVQLTSGTTRTIDMPTTDDLGGGPIFTDGPVDLNGWTVWAVFRSGSYSGRVAHRGVSTGPPNAAGMFVIPLPVGFSYDLLGTPPTGQDFPLQILYQNVDPQQSDQLGHQVRTSIHLTGAVTVGGAGGAAGCQVSITRNDLPLLEVSSTTATGGLYQFLVRGGKRYQLDVEPSPAAFASGALRYQDPDLFVPAADMANDIDLAVGRQVTFSGKLLDSQGQPAAGAQVWLRVQEAVMEAGSYPVCQAEPATVAADGGYLVTCNLDIP